MRPCLAVLAAAVTLAMAGCATVEHGTTQVVAIRPDPSDASCTVVQGPGGTPLAPTDGKLELPRSGLPLRVACTKPGYRPAEVVKAAMHSQKPFGGLSHLVDAASGANFSYPPVIRVQLESAPPGQP